MFVYTVHIHIYTIYLDQKTGHIYYIYRCTFSNRNRLGFNADMPVIFGSVYVCSPSKKNAKFYQGTPL